jgi:hypothetical protein
MTPEERRSVENGIWLCATCARIIDHATPEAYPASTLRAWKEIAERSAVRDAQASPHLAGETTQHIEAARDAVGGFSERWRSGEPSHSFDDFEGSARRTIEYSNRRVGAFTSEVLPVITDAITRAEQILGPDDPRVLAAKEAAQSAHVNYYSLANMVEKLQALATAMKVQ